MKCVSGTAQSHYDMVGFPQNTKKKKYSSVHQMQKRCNSIVNVLELRLSCNKRATCSSYATVMLYVMWCYIGVIYCYVIQAVAFDIQLLTRISLYVYLRLSLSLSTLYVSLHLQVAVAYGAAKLRDIPTRKWMRGRRYWTSLMTVWMSPNDLHVWYSIILYRTYRKITFAINSCHTLADITYL